MKKTLTCLLVAAMLLSCVSCSQTADEETSEQTTPQAEETIEIAEETESHYYDSLPEMNLGGKDFRIISRITDGEQHDVQSSTDYGNNEIDAQAINGTQINDTVYNRNRELEERFNFLFKSIQIDKNPMETAKTSILANSDDYDAIVDTLVATTDYTMFYPLDFLEHLDLTASCWDQNANSSLSISGKHYIAVGDMLILDKKGTWCHLFNKKLAADYQLGNLYDIVREGKWTIDEFYTMAQLASEDINGNGEQDVGDKWGFLTENYNTNIMMFGCGVPFTAKDENDNPILVLYNDHSVSAFEKVHEIMTDENTSMIKTSPDRLKAFSEDRALFYMVGIGTAMEYRYMDSDFGILPIPKYDETQDEYYTSLSIYNSAVVAIPKSSGTPDENAFIIQAISLASTDTLQVTFYDTVLNGVTIRDEDSREMLDIIFGNRIFDFGFIQNVGGLNQFFPGLLSGASSNFASSYKALERFSSKALVKLIEKYTEN